MRIKLDIPFYISEILKITDASASDNIDLQARIEFVSTDSRECCEGDLFVALDGANDTGEKYVSDAIKKNCFVISASNNDLAMRVIDTTEALLRLAKVYKSRVSPKHTVAVTGSVGKSTTVNFISAILQQKFTVHSTPGNFNNHIGVPLTLMTMPKDTEVLVTELGMNHRGEISRLSTTVNPDIGVITVIGTAHIGNLGSREEIAAAKLEILDGMSTKNLLLPVSEKLLSGINTALYVGRNSSLSDYSLNDTEFGTYRFTSRNKSIDGIHFFDRREHLLHDLTLAITVADLLGLSEEEIFNGVSAITEANLRQRFIELYDFTIFDDSYNASLESVSVDLKYISSLNRPTGAFIGDILELGEDTKEIHRKIGSVAAELKIDKLYLYGRYAGYTAAGALTSGMKKKDIFINTDLSSPGISINHIKQNHTPGEIILFKASHKLRFDKIADILKSEDEIC